MVVVMLFTTGCGESHRGKVDRAIQSLKTAPKLEMHLRIDGQDLEGQLSAQSVEVLSKLIEESSPDHWPLKYALLGTITYPLVDGGESELSLLYISDAEAGLRIDGSTYLRKLDPGKLKQLVAKP